MEEKIQIQTEDSHTLYGTLNWQEFQSNILIIFVHGFSGNQNRHLFFNGAKFFPQHDITTFRFNLYDSREGGRLLRECSIRTHSLDVDTVVKYFKGKFDKIYLVGHSLGGPSIIYSSQDVDVMILWEPSLVLDDSHYRSWELYQDKDIYIFKGGVEKLASKKMYDEWVQSNQSMVQLIKIPTCIICAGNGTLLNRWEKVIDKMIVPYKFISIEGANHGFDEEGVEDKLFQETLKYLKS